ncbi:YdcF family protein [Microbacterium sp. RG1]|nr:YdcF family protein [Microbacterium sp. RG1]
MTHWRASRRRLASPSARGTEAIVVLGYGNRGPRANRENRYRVRAGLRSIDPAAAGTILVFCGGTVEGPVPEAEIMAAYARDELGYRGPSVLEPTSRSTWQNVENAIPLIESADVIKIVSNSIHAELARGYLWMLRPDLAERLARGADYRFGEIVFVKPVAAVLGHKKLRRLRLLD